VARNQIAPLRPAQIDEHTWAVVQGLRRRNRDGVVQLFNRILVAVMIVGGLATAIAAGTSSRAMFITAIVSVGLGVVVMTGSLLHYWMRIDQLAKNPHRTVARYERSVSRSSAPSPRH